MHLDSAETNAIATRIGAIEARTGVQIVTAVVGRAARYPEARWKAFALGVSITALIVVVLAFLRPGGDAAGTALVVVVAILSVGIACALIATFVARFERTFVRHNRAEAEVRQFAEGLFLERGMFATASRTAVLIVVSVLERAVVVHPDRGFEGRVAASEWEDIVGAMTPMLQSGQRAAAIEAGLEALERLLASKGFVASGAAENVLPDRPIEERGA